MAFSARGIVHRSTVTGKRGMIASAHPLASVAGLRILIDGGNAIDAAVAVAAALNVVEPYMSGLGGDGYMHIYSAREREHTVLDYMGRAPYAATFAEVGDAASRERGAALADHTGGLAAAGSPRWSDTERWTRLRYSSRRSSTPSRAFR